MSRVNIVGLDGQPYNIEDTELDQALSQGYKLAQTEDYKKESALQEVGKDPAGDIKATAAAALRGLTMGVSDVVMTRFGTGSEPADPRSNYARPGTIDPEYLDALRKVHPTLSAAGEIGGLVAGGIGPVGRVADALIGAGTEASLAVKAAESLLPSRGVGALGASISQGVESSALSWLTGGGDVALRGAGLAQRALAKSAGLAVSGAVEGSLIGVGQAITENALGDPRDAGELLAAYVGPDAAIGGVAGGLFGVAGGLGGAAFARLTRRAEEGVADAIGTRAPAVVREQTFKSLGLRESQVRGLGEKKVGAALDTLLDPEVLGDGAPIVKAGADTPEILDRLKGAVSKAGQTVDAVIAGLDDVATKLDSMGGQASGLPAVRQTGMVPEGAELSPNRLIEGHVASEAELGIKRAPSMLDPANDLPNKQRIIDQVTQLAETEYKGKRPYKAAYKELQQIAQDLARDDQPFFSFREAQGQKVAYGSAFEGFARRGSKEDAWRKVYFLFSNEIENAAERSLNKIGAPEVLDIYKNAKATYYALKDVTDVAEGALADAGNAYIREITQQGKQFAKGLTWRMIYSGRSVASATSSSAAATGIRAAWNGIGDFIKPSRVANYANDAAKLRQIQLKFETFNKAVESKVDTLLKSQQFNLKQPAATGILRELMDDKNDDAAFDKYRHHVSMLMANPQKLAEQIAMSTDGLDGAAPNVAASFAETSARALAAISNAMPVPFNDQTLQPTLKEFQPASTDLAKFKTVVAAALKPASIFDDLASGILTPDAVDTVAAVYPALLDRWKTMIQAKVSAHPELISYNLRVQLWTLFGLPVDPTFEQDFVQRSQLAWAPSPEAQEKVRGSPPRLDPDDTRKLFEKKGFETTSQRIEGGVG